MNQVSQMEIEIQGMPQSIKSRYQTKTKSCKAELNRLKKASVSIFFFSSCVSAQEVLQKDLLATSARSDLLSSSASPSDDPYSSAASDRTRLLAGTTILEDSSRRLEEAEGIALETEQVGADTLRALRMQRDQLVNSQNTLREADGSIDRASGTLKKMVRRWV